MRKIIVQAIRKEQFIQKRPRTIYEILSDSNNGNKPLTSQVLLYPQSYPIYRYKSLYSNKKI